jgi:hypothetical protein
MVVNYKDWLRFSILGLNLLSKVVNEDFEFFSVGARAYLKIGVPVSETRRNTTINSPALASCFCRRDNELLLSKHDTALLRGVTYWKYQALL